MMAADDADTGQMLARQAEGRNDAVVTDVLDW